MHLSLPSQVSQREPAGFWRLEPPSQLDPDFQSWCFFLSNLRLITCCFPLHLTYSEQKLTCFAGLLVKVCTLKSWVELIKVGQAEFLVGCHLQLAELAWIAWLVNMVKFWGFRILWTVWTAALPLATAGRPTLLNKVAWGTNIGQSWLGGGTCSKVMKLFNKGMSFESKYFVRSAICNSILICKRNNIFWMNPHH